MKILKFQLCIIQSWKPGGMTLQQMINNAGRKIEQVQINYNP